MDIASTIARFANSFDEKDWAAMASTLADRITVDYSDFRGTKGVIARDEYVSQRETALSGLKTHHLLTNLEISEIDGAARCRASGLIYRTRADKFFHSHVIYEFELAFRGGRWEITGIKQAVLWHEGDPSIHAGAKNPGGNPERWALTSVGRRTIMTIREAVDADFAGILGLYAQLHPDDPTLNDARDVEVFQTIQASPWLAIFVLERDGRICSTCYLNVIPNITRAARPYAIIENVVTDQAYRGRGFGRALIQKVLAIAWERGCYKAMLQTGSKQASTHAFYRACGFSADDKVGYVARPG
ncbi:MAG: GNAT family N-acetyltransferase [Pseudomonadales bacterium]